MNFRELKEFVNSLTEYQLHLDVKFYLTTDDEVFDVDGVGISGQEPDDEVKPVLHNNQPYLINFTN